MSGERTCATWISSERRRLGDRRGCPQFPQFVHIVVHRKSVCHPHERHMVSGLVAHSRLHAQWKHGPPLHVQQRAGTSEPPASLDTAPTRSTRTRTRRLADHTRVSREPRPTRHRSVDRRRTVLDGRSRARWRRDQRRSAVGIARLVTTARRSPCERARFLRSRECLSWGFAIRCRNLADSPSLPLTPP